MPEAEQKGVSFLELTTYLPFLGIQKMTNIKWKATVSSNNIITAFEMFPVEWKINFELAAKFIE